MSNRGLASLAMLLVLQLTSSCGRNHKTAEGAKVEHLLSPFESFAPNVTVGKRKKERLPLPAEFDSCNQTALGESVRQYPLLYGPSHAHGLILSNLFEGIGGPGINPSCFAYGPGNEHAYTFAYFSELIERSPERLLTWNYLPGVVAFEAEAIFQDNHLRMEVRAQPEGQTGHTYWLDHCIGRDSVLFNKRSRYYYFNPEPIEIKFEQGPAELPERTGETKGTVLNPQVDILLNKQVDSWWEDLEVQGKAEPYLLVHQPEGALNILLYWQNGAVLKVQWGHCVHVNPAIISNGEPQTLTGELYLFRAELIDALAFARARAVR